MRIITNTVLATQSLLTYFELSLNLFWKFQISLKM